MTAVARRGKARAFFQMQVGDREQALLRPVQRASGVGNQSNAGNGDAVVPIRRRATCRQIHFIASFISSSAASANRESAASP